MITGVIVAAAVAFAALIGYASCVAAGRADRQSEAYFYLKMQEKEAEKRKEDLDKLTYNDIRALYNLDPIDENLKNE